MKSEYYTKQVKRQIALIEIKDALKQLTGDSIFFLSLKAGIDECRYSTVIGEILSQSKDNRPLVAKLIGENLLTKIEKLCGI